ncbi:hypothetical protein Acr_04g0001840 [Actinidia rufa]|uniref:Uncharacterized protein n=1 Tax=Actinidia rufa TaxID=165716 RepID=A0A7J0EGZ0_9ERIC|nr:hypothetical protein Acr_04g0001840 [Actinidia rufa]
MAEAQEKIQRLISDISSPYFLHSADHPRNPLVDIALTHTNYGSWSRAITMALCAKNKSGFIDNSLPCPTDEDIKPLWKRVSTMVLSWMLNSIDNSITPSLTSCRTPYELWSELESRFTQGNHTTIFKIQREISNLEQGIFNITNYYNNFKTLWDQLDSIDPPPECTCNTAAAWQRKVSNACVYQLLMGINEPYHVLRTQILAMDPLPDLGKVYGLLIAEEHTKTSQSVTTTQPAQEDSAMVSQKFQAQHNRPKPNGGQQRHHQGQRSFSQNHPNSHPQQPQQPFYAGPLPRQQQPNRQQTLVRANPRQPQNTQQLDPSSRPDKDPNAFCTHCNRAGHYKSGCFKLIGYPEWFFNRLSNQSSGRSNYAAQSEAMNFSPHLSPAEASQAYGSYDNPSALFTGYPPRHSGYRVFNLDTNTFFISRDVTFFENIFPFDSQSPQYIPPPANPTPSLTNLYPAEPLSTPDLPNPNTPNLPNHAQNLPPDPPNPTPPSTESTNSSTSSMDNTPPIIPNSLNHPSLTITSRPSRNHRPPDYLRDYICPTLPSATTASTPASSQFLGTVHPLSHFFFYSHFSPSHLAFLSVLSTSHDPTSYSQAIKHAHWRDAISKEINALEANKTWILTSLPPEKKPIGCKWIFKTKLKANGSVERYKARLVAKGYTQVEGLDFHDTFAPVAKLVTVRCVLAIAAARNWHLHQLDVNNAFLHGDLDEDVYMSLPSGYGRPGETRVCRLQKSLYGLKQTSRNWYSKLSTVLISAGFHQSQADHSLFTRQTGPTILVVLVYVDDLLLTGSDLGSIRCLQDFLSSKFQLKDLGKLKYFLGIEVARSTAGIFINQRKYILDILTDAGQSGCRPASSPMEQHLKLSADSGDPLSDPSLYRRLIGRLIYLTIIRPDITFAVNLLSQFMHTPRVPHLDAATRILRYLKGSISHGLLFSSNTDLTITGYTDSDWASCLMTRRSTTGYLITLGGNPVSWRTKKQSVVSRSSAEAEYRAMASTTCELLWLRNLLSDLAVPLSSPIRLYCDNQAALHIARNPVFHERSKHIKIDCHLIRERVQQGLLQLHHIAPADQLADVFTKALGVEQFRILTSKLGITLSLACQMFEEMPERDVVSWNTMIGVYVAYGKTESAIGLFDSMPERNIMTCNSVVAGISKAGNTERARVCDVKTVESIFDQIPRKTVVSWTAMISGLRLSAYYLLLIWRLEHGKWIDSYIKKNKFDLSNPLSHALIDMFAKCGDIENARAVFDQMACTHSGLAEEGNRVFDKMVFEFGIKPRIEHYGCTVDLLGRAGKLEEAVRFVESMHIEPKVIWATLLDALTFRVAMRHQGMEKVPGCSSIQIGDSVHEFIAKDTRHRQRKESYGLLDNLNGHLKVESDMQ